MTAWRYDRQLHRVWVCNCRIHHGLCGAALFALGVVLMWHDRKDIWWLRDNV